MADSYGFEDALDPDEDHRGTVEVGDSRVAVTDRRLLVRHADGAIRTVDRAELSGLERSVRGSRTSLFSATSFGVLAALLGLAGVVVARRFSFEAPGFDEGAAEEIGAGGLGGLVDWMFALFENLHLLLFATAGLFGLVAVSLGAYYRYVARESVLTLQLGGDQSNVHLPLEFAADDAPRRLERRLASEGLVESELLEEWETNQAGDGQTSDASSGEYGWAEDTADAGSGWGEDTADSGGGWGEDTADAGDEWGHEESEDTGDGW